DSADFSGGWTLGNNTTKQTVERVSASTWQTSKNPGGTPKAQNSLGAVIAPPTQKPVSTPPTKTTATKTAVLPKPKKTDNKVSVALAAISQPDGAGGTSNPWLLFI